MSISDLYLHETAEADAAERGLLDEYEVNRALYFVRMAENKKRRAKVLAAAERERIDAWENNQVEEADKRIEFWCQTLQSYHKAVLADDPKRKTLEFPNGRLRSVTPKKPEITYDADQLLVWAIENRPELVRTKVELNKTEINKMEPGEVGTFPTVEIKPAEPRFYVDVEVIAKGNEYGTDSESVQTSETDQPSQITG